MAQAGRSAAPARGGAVGRGRGRGGAAGPGRPAAPTAAGYALGRAAPVAPATAIGAAGRTGPGRPAPPPQPKKPVPKVRAIYRDGTIERNLRFVMSHIACPGTTMASFALARVTSISFIPLSFAHSFPLLLFVCFFFFPCSFANTIPKPKPKLPQARAMYDYEAQDADELLLRAGDMVAIVKKGL